MSLETSERGVPAEPNQKVADSLEQAVIQQHLLLIAALDEGVPEPQERRSVLLVALALQQIHVAILK